jgi:hypothetical protein
MSYIARLSAAAEDIRYKIEVLTMPLLERLAPLQEAYHKVLPYAVKVFHWTFIPTVVLLGMRTEPRPRFADLFSPI